MSKVFLLSPRDDDYLPSCNIVKAMFEGKEENLLFRDGSGSALILKIVDTPDGSLDVNTYYGFHFRLTNGYDALIKSGRSYGSLIAPFPDRGDPKYFEDFYSVCFADISFVS
jgi:hypothetical protein